MKMYKFKIDEKSLYYGIKNDYKKGQTATVSTPLNQSKDPSKWRHDILNICSTNSHVKILPDSLRDKCMSKTTAQANCKIDYFYKFDNIKVDGKILNCNCSFALYIKEEIDEFIKNRKGVIVRNTHLGRKKLHYPISLKYLQDGFNIDNKKVLDSILDFNGGFAYIVRAFECDFENNTLNIITSLVGLKGILLSSVFIKKKGVGKKLLLSEINPDDLIAIAGEYACLVDPSKKSYSSTSELFEEINKAKVENGKLGEDIIVNYIKSNIPRAEDIYHTSKDYPTSPYDIEYYLDGVKKYVEVKATSGNKKFFNMSSGEIKFMTKYKDDYMLFLVTNVKDKFPDINQYSPDKISKFKKEYPTTRFFVN